jgi:dTDP-4-dehydrorhamnose reductase
MRILITGSNGLLGQKIVKQLHKNKINFLATSQGKSRNPELDSKHFMSLDITDVHQIAKACRLFKPTAIINTAAMTNVDACELDPESCKMINIEGVKNLFDFALNNNIHFVQLSTDFVFDGTKGNYSEQDERNPLSVYAKSKVDAENILMNSNYGTWTIIRTIIVYGEGANLSRSNIVLWAKEALQSGKELNIVDDQFRAPTWADDLAWACIQAVKLNAFGVFHISGPETLSIFEIVMRIAQFYRFSTKNLKRTSSNELSQKAKRPPITGFNLSKSKEILGYSPKKLEDTLALLH